MSCRSVARLLGREAESLDEGDRLVLEEHLQGCASCRDERVRFAAARRIVLDLPRESIGPRGHARAIAAALMSGPRAEAAPRGALRWWMIAIPAGAALAALLLLVLRSGAGDEEDNTSAAIAPAPEQLVQPAPRLPPEAPTPAVVETEVVDGVVAHAGRQIAIGASIPSDAPVRVVKRAKLRVLGAQVVLAASSEVRYTKIDRAIVLDRGQIQLAEGVLRVVTDRFVVDLEGGAEVGPRSVAVRRGTARIVVDGKALPALGAGRMWKLEDRVAPPAANAAALVEQARAAYARGDHATAERHADAALDARPTRVQAAEARTILAECARVTGRLDDALARYDAIAARFGDLPAGETALFAAARLEASRGRTDAARALLRRYLDRYPAGRFADDARRQLATR